MWPFKRKLKLKINEKARCIDDRNWTFASPIVFHATYKIKDVLVCPTCNGLFYDVGFRFIDENSFTVCNRRKNQEHDLPGRGIRWVSAHRFEKLDQVNETIESINEEIQECIEKQEFEKAAELKKKLDKLS